MAHPRSRGENATHWAIAEIRAGSSPLTRGKLVGGETELSIPGLIPAHAGKTVGQGTPTVGHRAHPRSRGENLRRAAAPFFRAGSSPLTRGKHNSQPGCYYARGLIPAHAGKTLLCVRQPLSHRAHPRSRGENPHMLRNFFSAKGSSPLTRGKLSLHAHSHLLRRLIPAHAGKTP